MSQLIFHLAEPGDWANTTGVYSPASLESEGFIHCSTADQLPRVAKERFPDRTDLIVLTIDPDRLDPPNLVYEDLYDLDEAFPHVYGPLPRAAVLASNPYDPKNAS